MAEVKEHTDKSGWLALGLVVPPLPSHLSTKLYFWQGKRKGKRGDK
jgi:hypothetical protein